MLELRDVKENVKALLMEIPVIKTISGDMKALESQYKIDMAEVNLRPISLEEENKMLKSSFK